MIFDFNSYVSALNQIHTSSPLSNSGSGGDLTNSSSAIGQIIINDDFLTNNSLPKEIRENIGNLLTATFFTESLLIGNIKKDFIPNSTLNLKYIYSSTALSVYFKNLAYLVGIIPSFVTNFVEVTMAHIQGLASVEEFTNSAFSFVAFETTLIQTIGNCAEIELACLPLDLFQIQPIKPQIDQLHQCMLKCIGDGDAIRAKRSLGQASTEEEGYLAASLQTLNTYSAELSQVYTIFSNQVLTHFDNLLPADRSDSFVNLYNFSKNISNTLSSIIFISLSVSLYDPQNLPNVVKVLNFLMNQTFLMIHSITSLITFTGEFTASYDQAKLCHTQMKTVFEPLLQFLISSIPKCPLPFQNSVNTQLVPLFQNLQGEHNKFTQLFNDLVNKIVIMPEFIHFIGIKHTFDITEKILPSVNAISEVISVLEKNDEKNVDSLMDLFDEKFMKALEIFNNFASQNNDPVLISQKNSILAAVDQYNTSFNGLLSHKNNLYVRQKALLLAQRILICILSVDEKFLCIDSKKTIMNKLNDTEKALSKSISKFFITHLKFILDTLTYITSNSKECIPTADFEPFLGIFVVLMGIVRSCSGRFSNIDPSNPGSIIACLKEFDKIQVVFTSLYSSLASVELPMKIVAALQLLGTFAEDIRLNTDILRLCLQVKYQMIVHFFTSVMFSYADTVHTLGTYLNYTKFEHLKPTIDKFGGQIIQHIQDNAPPTGVYDPVFLEKLVAIYRQLFNPSGQMVQFSNTALIRPNSHAEIKKVYNDLNGTVQTLAEFSPYVSQIHPLNELIMPSFTGFIFQQKISEIDDLIANFLEGLKPTNRKAEGELAIIGVKLAFEMYHFAETLEYISCLNKISVFMKSSAQLLCKAVLSLEENKEKVLQEISDVLETNKKFKPLIANYASDVKEYGKAFAAKIK